jgi:hypothetical protein
MPSTLRTSARSRCSSAARNFRFLELEQEGLLSANVLGMPLKPF